MVDAASTYSAYKYYHSKPLGPDLTRNKWLWSDGSWAGITKSVTQGVMQPKQYRSPMPPSGGSSLNSKQAKAVAAYIWALSHR